MDITSYLTIDSEVQGNITGSCEHRGHKDKMIVLAFDHGVEIPLVLEHGKVGGKPTHQPVVVEKDIDCATPKLYQALFRGEKLSQVNIEWYRFGGKGVQELYYKIELSGALISSIVPSAPHVLNSNFERWQLSERISFIYESITWSWGNSGEILYRQNWLLTD
jgi:type VI secretion system secreted protein Hcp